MGKNILLGVTGSIASYKACDLVGLLRKKGHSVRCVMSRDAKWFVTPLTLETLTGQKVVEDMFRLPENRDPIHVSLADEADIILIAPATADVIGKVASGIADDMLTCTICASDCPVVFAPAMNDRMYNNPIVQDKIQYLREKGYHFIDPVVGHLACGREGIGHLAPLERIVEKTEKILAG
jgi:phosphopantothenoylcysteine decarboxylase/phosphopantothenate--cysteine ligase